MTLYDELFHNAYQIEKIIGDLYRRYAEAFKADLELSGLFKQLTKEEERHAKALKKQDLISKIKDPSISPLTILKSQREIMELIEQYNEEADRELTEKDALRNAFRIENSLPERLLKKIRNLVDNQTSLIFQKLSDEALEHSHRVRNFARDRQIRFSEA